MDALLSASDILAEHLRQGLSADGQPSDLKIRIEGNRAIIGSSSRALALAEIGCADSPPKARFGRLATDAIPAIIADLRNHLIEKP
jgi:hypothetical protein